MNTMSKPPDTWNRFAFRIVLSWAAIAMALVVGIHLYLWIGSAYVYGNGMYRTLQEYNSAALYFALWSGILLLCWSYFLLRAPLRYRDVRYGLIGICFSGASLLTFWLPPLDAYGIK